MSILIIGNQLFMNKEMKIHVIILV